MTKSEFVKIQKERGYIRYTGPSFYTFPIYSLNLNDPLTHRLMYNGITGLQEVKTNTFFKANELLCFKNGFRPESIAEIISFTEAVPATKEEYDLQKLGE